MRFLVVYNGILDPNGGASGTVWQTNEALLRLGHDLDVVSKPDLPSIISHHKMHAAVELPRRILWVVRDRLMKHQYDILLISQPYGYLVGKWLQGRKHAPLYIHRSHGHELAVEFQMKEWGDEPLAGQRAKWRRIGSVALNARLRRQARLALRFADGTVVPSNFDRNFLIQNERVDPRRVRTIFHAPVSSYLDVPPAHYSEERHQKMLFVGDFNKTKGANLLWEIATKTLRLFPELSLTIVTHQEHHGMAMAGFAQDVVARIRIIGWSTQDALRNIYDGHGLLIIPSFYEGASKAHYEGMARGLCVVASRVGAMCDSIKSGENGWLVPPGQSEGFADALIYLLKNYDVAKQLAHNARLKSLEFTWERTARELVEFATELLSWKRS